MGSGLWPPHMCCVQVGRQAGRPTLNGAMIGRVLGDARERSGHTQRAAAAKLGMSQSTLADIETGRRALTIEEAYGFLDLYRLDFGALDVRRLDPNRAQVRRARGRPRRK